MLEQHGESRSKETMADDEFNLAADAACRSRHESSLRKRRKFYLRLQRFLVIAEKRAWKILISILDWRCPCCDGNLSEHQVEAIKLLLKPGDLLLETNNAYPFWQIAVRVALGTNWSHSAFYPGGAIVIDAGTRPYVAEVPLDDFLGTSHIAVLRPRYQTREDLESATTDVVSCLGKPFNITFDHNNRKTVYCAQLVSNALERMPHPIRISRRQMLWKKIVSPEDLEKNPEVDCLWSSHPMFWLNLCHHWPLGMALSLGMMAGWNWGYAGAVCGGTLAVFLLTAVSVRIRKDEQKAQHLCRSPDAAQSRNSAHPSSSHTND